MKCRPPPKNTQVAAYTFTSVLVLIMQYGPDWIEQLRLLI